MSCPVESLVEQLHAKRSGKGWLAKCPVHEDHKPSLSLDEGADGRALLKCHAGCSTDDVIAALGLTRRDLFPAVSQRQSGNGTRSILDWRACMEALTEKHVERLAGWRVYSVEVCHWLKENGFVGLYEGHVAFPIRNESGNVVAAQYRLRNADWQRYPIGHKTRPIVIGQLVSGDPVHVFESQWDAFAFMDKSGERGGIVITLGASNGALVADLIPPSSTAYVWTQDDKAGAEWEQKVCANTKEIVKRCQIPAPHKDLNDWTRAGATSDDLLGAILKAEVVRQADRLLIEFRSPLQLKKFIPPPGIVLVGDCHIVKGATFVIGGAPGVGKSRASVALAVAGATCSDWFGLPVHRRLKVMIIQTENGEFRLSKEFRDLDCDSLEHYVRICPPPPYGLCLQRNDFRAQLIAAIAEFRPDIVIFDPWNAVARDEKAKEYLETFNDLRSVLPLGDDAPALGIVAHTRKPKTDEHASGRALLNLPSGSYVLGSVPRTVFVMQAGSDNTTDNQVVWTCCKNNDGALGPRSAWERRNGLFAPVTDFDWESFDAPEKNRREVIGEADIRGVFDNGPLTKGHAVKELSANTGASQASCYRALSLDGRFGKHLNFENGLLSWQ